MKLSEIVLTQDLQFLHNMIERALPHGLSVSHTTWLNGTRTVPVVSIETAESINEEPLIKLQIAAYPDRPATSKTNILYINNDDVGKWTIKKQGDGTFLLLKREQNEAD